MTKKRPLAKRPVKKKQVGKVQVAAVRNNACTTRGNPSKIIGKGFDKRPQNINRKGQPKRVAVSLTEYIEKQYDKRPPKAEVLALMEYIESLSVEKLTEFVKDKGIPAIVQAYGRLLLTGDQKDFRRVQGAEMINDRLHGKPKQSVDQNFNMTVEHRPFVDLPPPK
jgi:hypothetical protein